MADKLKDIPLYDDMGNLIQAPGGLPFINEAGNIEVRKVPDGRTVMRNAGCFNCLHYERDTVYDATVARCHTRDIDAYKARGLSDAIAHRRADQVRKLLQTKKGLFGVCTSLMGKSTSDFVAARYLCTNWSGTTGASLARAAGEPLSPLAGEVIEKLDGEQHDTADDVLRDTLLPYPSDE